MNYNQTLEYLFAKLPMYQRIGSAAYKANLDNTLAICKLLDHPENKFKTIHVGGTNGKGSTSHMLAAIFQQAGYKTGLYTSPHLKDFRERIKINGKEIPKKYVTNFVEKYQFEFEKIKPSFFEWTVGLAFNYFAEKKVDVAIIEVGLGGRLDSTNVISPLVSVITNIGYDHTNLLGKTLGKIAAEKAGIIKPNTPVVISESQQEVKKVFINSARKNKSEIYFADELFMHQQEKYFSKKNNVGHIYKKGEKEISLLTDLPGTYQKNNIAGVLAAIDICRQDFKIKQRHVKKALKKVKTTTGLLGRWEVISKHPRIICDTGHNEDGIKQVIQSINREYNSGIVKEKLHVVFGVVNDKDLSKIFPLLKSNMFFKNAVYYFCKPNIPRGMETEILTANAKKYGLIGNPYASVKQALKAAKKHVDDKGLIFVGGSTFTVAEI